jgi:hypothetical protein
MMRRQRADIIEEFNNIVDNKMRIEFKNILKEKRKLVKRKKEYKINQQYNNMLLKNRLEK